MHLKNFVNGQRFGSKRICFRPRRRRLRFYETTDDTWQYQVALRTDLKNDAEGFSGGAAHRNKFYHPWCLCSRSLHAGGGEWSCTGTTVETPSARLLQPRQIDRGWRRVIPRNEIHVVNAHILCEFYGGATSAMPWTQTSS